MYSSDESSESESGDDGDNWHDKDVIGHTQQRLPAVPPQKRRRREVPYRTERLEKKKQRYAELKDGLKDLQKLLKSKKTTFMAGPNGLQARRTHAIETHLRLIIVNGRTSIDASGRAAESCGFAVQWGGRQVRKCTYHWINTSVSTRGIRKWHLFRDGRTFAQMWRWLSGWHHRTKIALAPGLETKLNLNDSLAVSSGTRLLHSYLRIYFP
jgi:hypothetical protein